MKLFYGVITILLAGGLAAQPINEAAPVGKMTWLVGSWKGMFKGQPFYEAWRKVNDDVLVNFSIEIKGTDTVVKEETAIITTNKNTVFGRNKEWQLKRIMMNEIMFECDTCKFSNRIIFLRTNEDHWFTILQHPKSTIYYDLVRVPELDAVVDRYITDARKTKK